DRGEVLRGDHLEGGLLPVQLRVDGGRDGRVELVQGRVQKRHCGDDSSAGDVGVVLGGGQQVGRLVGDAHLEQPTALEGSRVHQGRVVHHVLVDRGDLAGDRAVEVAD